MAAAFLTSKIGQGVAAICDFLVPATCMECGRMVESDGGLCADCWPRRVSSRGPIAKFLAPRLPTTRARARSARGNRRPAAVRPPTLGHGLWRGGAPAGRGPEVLRPYRSGAMDGAADGGFRAPFDRGLRTRSSRCRCIRAGSGNGGSTSRPNSPAISVGLAGSACEMQALHRVEPTRRQVGLGHDERARNVQGAFRVPAGERRTSKADGYCWSTMYIPPGRRRRPARGH